MWLQSTRQQQGREVLEMTFGDCDIDVVTVGDLAVLRAEDGQHTINLPLSLAGVIELLGLLTPLVAAAAIA